MAAVKGPLMSIDASGSIAKTITFSKWKGRNYVRKLVIPANPKSGLQVGMRSVFKFITQDFTNLSAARVASWKAIADLTAITPLNAQVAADQALARRNLGWIIAPGEAAGTTPDAAVGLTVNNQPGAFATSWTAGAAAPEYAWAIHLVLGGSITEAISNLVVVVPAATLAVTILVADSSLQFTMGIQGVNFDGEFGAQATLTINP